MSNTISIRQYAFTPKFITIFLLVLFHFFGLLGMNLPQMNQILADHSPFESFVSLTPFNLLLTCGLLLYFQKSWNKAFLLFTITCFLVGFLAEVAGVHTGLIFGEYAYGKPLGWQLWEVPLTIGINWLTLVYASCAWVFIWKVPQNLKPFLGASIMTGLDILIEPVAIHLNFWHWSGSVVPLQNYFAWFLISYLLCSLFFRLGFKKNNELASWVLGVQFLFFLGQFLLI